MSVEREEIEHFSKDAPRWWDEEGPFAPLHALNPVRLEYIKAQICSHFGHDVKNFKALAGLNILDIGCGGGLVAEPVARMGASVTGIDADNVAIGVAKDHAAQSGVKIDYQCTSAESLLLSSRTFDVILALEIAEHVSNLGDFVASCSKLLKPGGLAIFSTLNRTPKSFALGIVAAEYILRWVPRGTHSWKKFVKPSELAAAARQNGLSPADITGLIFNPLKGGFTLSKTDLDVNYLMSTVK
ncbi:MAG TPA: bifunctional 3-demethylubiquinol 3-O-methyltransferase/2-polyprenyl-6-hydroxyphenol methylase [Parvularcula sp.]|nr:bifunctional 3-demethylubiquinol 3-O-methyltransferase/2-polyprenyl-6-hydroxyphenol methylase [Parvularcula sp.]